MIKFEKLDDLDERIKNLDLTNSILLELSMAMNDDDKLSYINENDKRVIKNESDNKLVNDIMSALLDENILNNKLLYEKIKEIIKDLPDDHILKERIQNAFRSKSEEILNNKSNRWHELKSKDRNNNNKYKNLKGFFPIYEKPGDSVDGNLNIKLIDKPASSKEIQKYSKKWCESKYFNIWMRKQVINIKEIYITKLMNLFYGGEENLYKTRSPLKDNSKLQQILVKFIPNVYDYFKLESDIEKSNDDKFNEIRERIDSESVLKFLISNFLIQNNDLNEGNILIKEKNNKLKFIPIDFEIFVSEFKEEISKFTSSIKNQDFESTKKYLIDYIKDIEPRFKKQITRNNKKIQSHIDLEYQLNRIPDNDFKEILTNMFSKYDEMNDMLNKYKEKFPNEETKIQDVQNTLKQINDAINEIKEKPIPYINIKSINEVNITKPTEIKNSQQP